MNVVFRLKDEKLEAQFVKECSDQGMIEVQGHRYIYIY
jgi:phosphoserine aminotransferase